MSMGHCHFNITKTGNSDAVFVPLNYNKMTCLLSNISGGHVKIQYSLSSFENIKDNTAIWHDWSIDETKLSTGLTFDSPITYLRVFASDDVTYTLELLI